MAVSRSQRQNRQAEETEWNNYPKENSTEEIYGEEIPVMNSRGIKKRTQGIIPSFHLKMKIFLGAVLTFERRM